MYLLRAGAGGKAVLSRQGRLADFSVNQNPPQQPWKPWGPYTSAEIVGGVLRLYNSANWFTLAGGWNNEFQPLTASFGFEITVDLEISSGNFYGYFGAGWTSNQTPDDARFIAYFDYGKWETGAGDNRKDHYGIRLIFRDKNDLLAEYADSNDVFTATQMAQEHTIRVSIIEDSCYVLWLDGIVRACWPVPATGDKANFRTSPGHRGINFRQTGGYCDVKRYYAYDYSKSPTFYKTATLAFSDNFNRANGAPGNGWTISGSNLSISGNALCINGFFPSDGFRSAMQAATAANGDVAININIASISDASVNDSYPTLICLRVNAARTLGIGLKVMKNKLEIVKWTGSPTSPTFTLLAATYLGDLALSNGNFIQFLIYKGVARALVLHGTGGIVCWAENIDAHSPPTNLGYGLIFQRGTLVNSAAVDNFDFYNLT